MEDGQIGIRPVADLFQLKCFIDMQWRVLLVA